MSHTFALTDTRIPLEEKVHLVSVDLNGTLINASAPEALARIAGGDAIEVARAVREHHNGSAGIVSAINYGASQIRGLSLYDFVRYWAEGSDAMPGLAGFLEGMHERGTPVVVNTTAFREVASVYKHQLGPHLVRGVIGNSLQFANGNEVLTPYAVDMLIAAYFGDSVKFGNGEVLTDYSDIAHCFPVNGTDGRSDLIDCLKGIKATGSVDYEITTEVEKFDALGKYLKSNFPWIDLSRVAHVGDALSEYPAMSYMLEEWGGVVVGFNATEGLYRSLAGTAAKPGVKGHILVSSPNFGPHRPDLRDLLEVFA
ncbi:MAG: hypothetical protein HY544_00770 [Candidatus Diapherotrites archaeon]|uniref:Uncharacterized protein n=1 Tax=Candidatus Iainarchaeum sp. TaxID=3101447 RepID=A0A8T3YJ00_9ARCH|nr:hypothetical protein [Candidatus Diapherotrites archaeon]